ncbi:MAG: glycosyltransferase, partial [Candidatus Aminicenantes bacterium]|nr:glycosyltransferase [Candidatus Aminicenantes bacterium]
MKIGFDIRPFLSGETGVGVYFKNLLHAMAKMERDDNYYLFSSSLKERFPVEFLPTYKNLKFKDFRIPVSVMNFLWFRLSFPPMGVFFREKLDLTHSPNPLYIPGGRKKIITVYDLSFIDTPELAMAEATRYFSRRIEKSIKKADAIITISEFTRSRIREIFGKRAFEKTSVIYLGSDINQ